METSSLHNQFSTWITDFTLPSLVNQLPKKSQHSKMNIFFTGCPREREKSMKGYCIALCIESAETSITNSKMGLSCKLLHLQENWYHPLYHMCWHLLSDPLVLWQLGKSTCVHLLSLVLRVKFVCMYLYKTSALMLLLPLCGGGWPCSFFFFLSLSLTLCMTSWSHRKRKFLHHI